MSEAGPRSFTTFFQKDQLDRYQAGVMGYRYRGLPCLKSPIDLGIYLKLLWDLKPRTIVELGSRSGGSALFFRDVMRAYEQDSLVVSIDLEPPASTIKGVAFIKGNAAAFDEALRGAALPASAHPWLIIDDSAHTSEVCRAVLEQSARALAAGEYLLIEDGVLKDLGWAERYGGGPNHAIRQFLESRPGLFEVDTGYCDMFGTNATYNPNAYLRRA